MVSFNETYSILRGGELLQDGPFDQYCHRLVKEGSLTSAVVGIAGQRPLIIKIAFHMTSCHASQDSERLELLYQFVLAGGLFLG